MRREGTAADHARWQQKLELFLANGEGGVAATLPIFPELFCAGEWLSEQLGELRLSDETIARVCMATGQRMAMGADPWEVSRQALAQVKAGTVPVPGEALSAQLVQGMGLEDLFQTFVQQGLTPEQVAQLVNRFRASRQPVEPAEEFGAELFPSLYGGNAVPDTVADRLLARYREAWEKRHA